jgi:hypothetical protein
MLVEGMLAMIDHNDHSARHQVKMIWKAMEAVAPQPIFAQAGQMMRDMQPALEKNVDAMIEGIVERTDALLAAQPQAAAVFARPYNIGNAQRFGLTPSYLFGKQDDGTVPLYTAPQPQAEPRTPIENLMAQYTNDGCDFTDMAFVRAASLRYVKTMPDSQVRCLLYALATAPQPQAATESCPAPSVRAEAVEWCYSNNEEVFTGRCASREDAISEALDYYGEEVEFIWIGVAEPLKIERMIRIDPLLECISEAVGDEVGDIAEEWPKLSEKDEEDLIGTIAAFVRERCKDPPYTVRNVECLTGTEALRAAPGVGRE